MIAVLAATVFPSTTLAALLMEDSIQFNLVLIGGFLAVGLFGILMDIRSDNRAKKQKRDAAQAAADPDNVDTTVPRDNPADPGNGVGPDGPGN